MSTGECTRCGAAMELNTVGRRREFCTTCRHARRREASRRYYTNGPTREYARRPKHDCEGGKRCEGMWTKYKITCAQYDYMKSSQLDCCAICGSAEHGKRPLMVDHDHEDGRIRGLLCTRCNVGLGYFQDNPEALSAAVVYLTTRKEAVSE